MDAYHILAPAPPVAARRPKLLTETRLRTDIDVDQIDIEGLRQLVRGLGDRQGDWIRRYDIEDDKVKRSDADADINYRDYLRRLHYDGEARIQRFDKEMEERVHQRALAERYGHIEG